MYWGEEMRIFMFDKDIIGPIVHVMFKPSKCDLDLMDVCRTRKKANIAVLNDVTGTIPGLGR